MLAYPFVTLFHIFFSLFADVVLFFCGVLSLFYLLVNSSLKKKRFSSFVDKLPALTTLEKTNYVGLTIAFASLSFGTLSGSFLASIYWGDDWYLDVRQLWSMITWFLIFSLLAVRYSSGMRGQSLALGTLLALSLSISSALFLDYLPFTKHSKSSSEHIQIGKVP